MKKQIFRTAVIIMILALVCSLTGCVSIEQRLLNAFKALQNAKACHLLIGVSIEGAPGGTGPLKLDMDMSQSGQNYAMKGAVSLKAAKTDTNIPFELYLKEGSMYMGTSVMGSATAGSSKYIRMSAAEASALTGGLGIAPLGGAAAGADPQGMVGFLSAVKGIDFRNVKFDFSKDTRTVSGKQVQLDKVTLTPTAEERKKLVSALAGSGLAAMVDIQDLTFTLWLGEAGIARVECQAKAAAAANAQDAGGVIPAGPYTVNIGVDILETGDTLNIAFPDFTEQNTLDMQQYIQQVTQDFVQDLPGSPPGASPAPTPGNSPGPAFTPGNTPVPTSTPGNSPVPTPTPSATTL